MSLKSWLNPAFFPPRIKNSDWISEQEAAKRLGISQIQLEFMVFSQHLEPAKNSNSKKGVTRKSLKQEIKWRNNASTGQRLRRLFGDILGWPIP